MPAKISVSVKEESATGWVFEVTISERGSETVHTVTLSKTDYERLTEGKARPESLIERSFEFLLQREPKESILRRFDLTKIGFYFPQYEREIRRRLG